MKVLARRIERELNPGKDPPKYSNRESEEEFLLSPGAKNGKSVGKKGAPQLPSRASAARNIARENDERSSPRRPSGVKSKSYLHGGRSAFGWSVASFTEFFSAAFCESVAFCDSLKFLIRLSTYTLVAGDILLLPPMCFQKAFSKLVAGRGNAGESREHLFLRFSALQRTDSGFCEPFLQCTGFK
jgi:hypothetical protein